MSVNTIVVAAFLMWKWDLAAWQAGRFGTSVPPVFDGRYVAEAIRRFGMPS